MRRLLLILPLAISATTAAAKPCRPGDVRSASQERPGCERPEKLVPYEPGAQRTERPPGFINLGNGTEVRVGGRVQMDYDRRRP